MPDPSLKTVSASQVPALFNVSPYTTRWMLYQQFKGHQPVNDDNIRADWGIRLEPQILQWIAEQVNLEHRHNRQYVTHPTLPIGATIDGELEEPDIEGAVIAECKNVDSMIFRERWDDWSMPDDIELQVQAQLIAKEAKRGYIGALVGGNNPKLYKREPIPKLRDAIISEAQHFLDDVAHGREPDPLGIAKEIPMLRIVYPRAEPDQWLDLRGEDNEDDVAQLLMEMKAVQVECSAADKVKKELQARILAVIKDNQFLLAGNWQAKHSTWDTQEIVIPAKENGGRRLTIKELT